MKMGAEPKKVAVFVGLIAVAAIVYWMNSSSDAPPSSPSPSAHTAVDPAAAVAVSASPTQVALRRDVAGHPGGLGGNILKLPKNVDPTKVDPTLRLDLLAKLQSLGEEGGTRNIFQIGQPPPDPVLVGPSVKPSPFPNPGKIDPNQPPAVASTPKPPDKPAGPPPPAPINLKYYGYSTTRSDGERKAFFLNGDDVIVAAEGEIIEKHYKVLRITNTKVDMEDTASKSTQSIPLTPEAAPA